MEGRLNRIVSMLTRQLLNSMAILRYDLTDIAHIAFMFNGGQSPASILSPICTTITL